MPKVENISVETLENKDVIIHLRGSDDVAVFEVTKQPQHGAWAIDPKTGHLQYRGEKGFIGVDHITYIGSDKENQESLPADVVIDVKDAKNFQKVVELTIDVPVDPDVEDLLDVLHMFTEELEEIIIGDEDDDN